MCHLNDLPLDVVYEILGHLPVVDIIRCRQACKRLFEASYQRSVWVHAYKQSHTLLLDPLQSSTELEASLVRATKIHWNWTSPRPIQCTRRRFSHELPMYDFHATVILGRYLQLAERQGIAWYDLDSTDMKALLAFSYPALMPTSSCLTYQVNASGEGEDVVWVAFLCNLTSRVLILKVCLGQGACSVRLHAELQGENVIGLRMDYDWLLLIREFSSLDEPMELIHIPSRTTLHVPMHEEVRHPSELNDMKFVITPRHLFLMFSVRTATLVDTYPLPIIQNVTKPSRTLRLVRSHAGVYAHAISNIQVLQIPSTSNSSMVEDIRISFLALVYIRPSPTNWTSKIGLHLFDADLNRAGTVSFTARCHRILDVGIATTTLSLTSRGGNCLAVTHSSPGPVILAHYIRCPSESECVMDVKTLKLPEGMQSREMVGFDGVRGRLCVITGWTNIEILDYA